MFIVHTQFSHTYIHTSCKARARTRPWIRHGRCTHSFTHQYHRHNDESTPPIHSQHHFAFSLFLFPRQPPPSHQFERSEGESTLFIRANTGSKRERERERERSAIKPLCIILHCSRVVSSVSLSPSAVMDERVTGNNEMGNECKIY